MEPSSLLRLFFIDAALQRSGARASTGRAFTIPDQPELSSGGAGSAGVMPVWLKSVPLNRSAFLDQLVGLGTLDVEAPKSIFLPTTAPRVPSAALALSGVTIEECEHESATEPLRRGRGEYRNVAGPPGDGVTGAGPRVSRGAAEAHRGPAACWCLCPRLPHGGAATRSRRSWQAPGPARRPQPQPPRRGSCLPRRGLPASTGTRTHG